MKKVFIIVMMVIGLVVLAFVNSFVQNNQQISPKINQNAEKTLKIGEISLNVEVVDTEETRMRGLSGKVGLSENEGMLFVFEKSGNYGFWMKDMKFAIDIVWIDKEKKIIYMESGVLPKTYPKIFGSNVTSLFVLEIPSGFLVKNNIKIGDFVAF
jgi:uncharacterized membrane protein (UPF0127 family)